MDGAGKDAGAAVGLIISIDAGDNGVAKVHAGGGFGYADGFVFVGRADRFAGGDRAETAGTRTNIPKDHEGGSAVFPAFAHVGTARRFANGVEIEGAHDALEVVIFFAAEEFDAEPVWARVCIRGGDVCCSAVGDDVEGRGHGVGLKVLFYVE